MKRAQAGRGVLSPPELGNGWAQLLADELADPRWAQLVEHVAGERKRFTVFPARGDVFRAFALTPPKAVRVVILGQDPYHGPGQAHGLSFSVPPGCRWPPSLRNVFRELVDDLGCPAPAGGDLSAWARRGVLLLNTVLTVRAGAALSHRGLGWEWFTGRVLERIAAGRRPVAFLLWGAAARALGQGIPSRHLVLESAHPSPLSARRGFFGSRHFSRSSAWLESQGRGAMDWSLAATEGPACAGALVATPAPGAGRAVPRR